MTTTQTTSAGSAGLMWAATIEAPSSGWAVTRKAIDPDAALVERLRREDAGAVEALVRAYGDRVYRLAMRITGNASDAEEVVQDALWTASRKIDTFRGRPPSAPGCTGSPPTPPTRSCGEAEQAERSVVGRPRPVIR